VNTVESLADMTPEQLEAIEGIGPKTVEKISIAVNNYFASLDGGEAVAAAELESTGEAATEAAFSEESLAEGSVEADALAAEAEPIETAPAEVGAELATEEAATEEAPTEEPATEEAPEDKQS
jgi:N utilization substance protein A